MNGKVYYIGILTMKKENQTYELELSEMKT